VFLKRSNNRQLDSDAAGAGAAGCADESSENNRNRPEGKPQIMMLSDLSRILESYLSYDFDVDKPYPSVGAEMERPEKPVSKTTPRAGIGLSLPDQLAYDRVAEHPDKESEVLRTESLLLKRQLEIKDRYAMLRRQRFYRTFFQGFDEALLFVKPDTLQIVEANEAASRLLGRRSNQLKDTTLRALVAQEFRPVLDTYIIRLLFDDLSPTELNLVMPEIGTKSVSMKGAIVKHNSHMIGILLQLS